MSKGKSTKKKRAVQPEVDTLISLIQETLELCQEKFSHPDTRRAPSCMLSLRVQPDGAMTGYYLPILYQWGWNEYDHLVYGDGVYSLPFSHEDTWEYLTETTPPKERVLKTCGEWKAVLGGIRAGQVFFVHDIAEYHALGLEAHIKGGSLRRGASFVAAAMRRAWQEAELTHEAGRCAFCVGNVDNPVPRGDFIIFDNRFKPHPWHKVLVPSSALLERFPPSPRSGLLHPAMLSGMLRLIPELCNQRKDAHSRVQCGLHLGLFGGQTIAHPHLHFRQ
jgi:hypothetical protein